MQQITSYIKLVLIMLFCNSAFGQLKSESVTIYKNGTAFIHRSGKVKLKKGTYNWNKNLPSAIFGTFWFSSPSATIKGITSKNGEIKSEREWLTFLELLRANMNRTVKITTQKDEVISGVIKKVSTGTSGGVVIIKTGTSNIMMREYDIKRVDLGEKFNQKIETTEHKTNIKIDFNSSNSMESMNVMYLTSSLQWTPMYRLLLTSNNEAVLRMRASVVNNAEDLKNTNLNLAAGNPNFYSTTSLSDLLNFGVYNAYRSNVTFKNTFTNNTNGRFYDLDESVRNKKPNNISQELEDLHLFKLKNINLDKGERAFYDLFENKVKIEHKYVCNLKGNATYNRHHQKYSLSEPTIPFAHQIKVYNETKNPFSSGTILVTKKHAGFSETVGSAKLNYTSIGDCAYVDVASAPDVDVKQSEKETLRNTQKKVFNNYQYVLITVSATFTVQNFKNEKVSMVVNRTVDGDLLKTSTPWKSEHVIGVTALNPKNKVSWEFELEGGTKKEVTYSYTTYVRI